MAEECPLPAPRRLPSEVGLEAEERLKLTRSYPSIRPVIERIISILENLGVEQRPRIILLVGDWGEGKTSIYRGIVKRDYCGSRLACAELQASDLYRIVSMASREAGVAADADVLIWSIACAYLRRPCRSLHHDFEEFIKAIGGGDKPILVFIDEFEDVVARLDAEGQGIVSEIVEGLTQLANGNSPLLQSRGLIDRFHVMIAVSRSAYHTLSTRRELASIIPRLIRRADIVELSRLTQLESIHLFSKLLQSIFGDGVDAARVASPPTLLNPMISASMGIPGALEHVAGSLARSLTLGCKNGARRLEPGNAREVYENIEVTIEASREKILIPDEYAAEERECIEKLCSGGCSDREAAERACRLLLLSGTGVPHHAIDETVGSARSWMELTTSGMAVICNYYRIEGDPVAFLDDAAAVISKIMHEYEPVISKIAGKEATPLQVYRVVLDAYACLGWDGSIGFCIPVTLREEYVQRLGVSESEASILYKLVERLLGELEERSIVKRVGECLYVPFSRLTRYIFSHELSLLSFLPRERRLEAWRRLSRELSPRYWLPPLAALILRSTSRLLPDASSSDTRLEWVEGGEALLATISGRSVRLSLNLGTVTPIQVRRQLRLLLVPGGEVDEQKLVRLVDSLGVERAPHLIVLVYVGSPGRVGEGRQAEQQFQVPVLTHSMTRSEALQLTAIGWEAEEAGISPERLAEYTIRALEGARVGTLPGFTEQLADTLHRLYVGMRLDGLFEEARERLENRGVLLPERLEKPDGSIAGPDEARYASLWLALYPHAFDMHVTASEIYETIEDDVKRYMIFGKRYTELIGRDIESPGELEKYILALHPLKLIDIDTSYGIRRIKLTVTDSPYYRRLLAYATRPLRLEHVSTLLIDRNTDFTSLKALLESLYALGMLVKDGESWKIIDTDELKAQLQRLSDILANLRASYGTLLEKMAIHVYGKERGFRVAWGWKLLERIRRRVESAQGLLGAGRIDEAARLATAAARMLTSLLGERPSARSCQDAKKHLELAALADREYRRIVRDMQEALDKLRDARKMLEDALSEYVAKGGRVQLNIALEASLARALNEAHKLRNEVIDEAQAEAAVAAVWKLKPSHAFPFYYKSGADYCFNLKLYKLKEELGAEELIQRARELISQMQKYAEIINKYYQGFHEKLGLLKEKLEKLARHPVVGRIASKLAIPRLAVQRISMDNVVEVDDVGTLIERVGSKIDLWKHENDKVQPSVILERLEKLREKVDRALEERRWLEERIGLLKKVVGEAINACSGRSDVLGILAKVDELLDDAKSIVESVPREPRLEDVEDARSAERIVEEWLQLLEEAVKRSGSRVREAEELLEEAWRVLREEAERIRDQLKLARAIARLVNANDVLRDVEESELRLRKALEGDYLKIHEACRAVSGVGLEELQKMVEAALKKSGLGRVEAEVVKKLAGGRALRWRDIQGIASELGVGLSDVLAAVAKLAEKGIIDVKVEPYERISD